MGRLRRLLRALFVIEPLPADPPPPAGRGRAWTLLVWLFVPEPLPLDPPVPVRHRGGMLRWMFGYERLPHDNQER